MVDAILERLTEVARRGEITSYAEIARLAHVDLDNPHFGAVIGRLLDEINRAEHAAGRPLVSAVVVSKERNMPGPGFFDCARTLGLYRDGDDLGYWVEELGRVHRHWASH